MADASSAQPVIGVVGGIGSGKTLVAGMLGALGCRVVSADLIGHELLSQKDVIASLVERFGEGILDESGAVSRTAVAGIVFDDPQALADLNATVHPLLRAELVRRISEHRADPAFGAPIVLDAALLLDTDWHDLCDVIVFVDSPLEARVQRVAEGRGWSAEQLARREKNQNSLDLKRSKSDDVVWNNSSVPHLQQQVHLLYQRVVGSKDVFP
jgi:dephospho-CoA kinase